MIKKEIDKELEKEINISEYYKEGFDFENLKSALLNTNSKKIFLNGRINMEDLCGVVSFVKIKNNDFLCSIKMDSNLRFHLDEYNLSPNISYKPYCSICGKITRSPDCTHWFNDDGFYVIAKEIEILSFNLIEKYGS